MEDLQDEAVLPTLDFDPAAGITEALDVNSDGVVDGLLTTFANGSWVATVDTTGDMGADLVKVHVADGEPELAVREDGQGGYVLQVDTNGDGEPDTDVPVDRQRLETDFPELLALLDAEFAGLTPGQTDGSEQLDDGDASGSGTWSVSDGQLLGDPTGASEHWFEQAANGFCVPASVTQIVAAYTGSDIMNESSFVQRANDLHLFTVGPDGVPGMDAAGAAELLEDAGVDAHVEENLTILDLENFLNDGRPIMLAVDADEMWYSEADAVDEAANHAVVLTGIDPVNGVAIISDPGSPTGNEYTMSLAELDAIWEDSGRQAVVVDQPTDVTDGAVGDQVALAGDEDVNPAVEAGEAVKLDFTLPGLAEETLSPLDAVGQFISLHPIVLLPVVIAAGSLMRGLGRH